MDLVWDTIAVHNGFYADGDDTQGGIWTAQRVSDHIHGRDLTDFNENRQTQAKPANQDFQDDREHSQPLPDIPGWFAEFEQHTNASMQYYLTRVIGAPMPKPADQGR